MHELQFLVEVIYLLTRNYYHVTVHSIPFVVEFLVVSTLRSLLLYYK